MMNPLHTVRLLVIIETSTLQAVRVLGGPNAVETFCVVADTTLFHIHLPFNSTRFLRPLLQCYQMNPLRFRVFHTFCNSYPSSSALPSSLHTFSAIVLLPSYMASSSSSQPRSSVSPKLYDVFISHRGPDVKDTIAKQLYDLLKARDCKAFLDREEIEGGGSLTSAIDNAICSSLVQIAIFSKRYAESSWCLDELVLMLQQPDALFIPVFYDIQPWELRHIDKKENEKRKKRESQYAAAFYDFRRKGRHLDKLDEWEQALASAADISGYEYSIHQEDLCEEIVSRVLREMEKRRPIYVAKYPVGLDELVQDFGKSCPETAQTVGIFGLGGIGKSTLARELFNGKRSSYSASCFLPDVRESHARGGLQSLQSKLIKDLFDEGKTICDTNDGIGQLKHHLERAKDLQFLIVLDDIDCKEQLDALLPEGMLGSGRLVIITTRDQSLLRAVDFCYKMKVMDEDRAKALFCSHALRGRAPAIEYERLVKKFVKFCGGLPLSLIVLGAHVYGRGERYWELELDKVKKILPEEIMRRLKISFDGLDTGEKQIFIDIACFFNKIDRHRLVEDAIIIWKASGWSAEHALQTLKDKCLVDKYPDTFEMHDHLRDLGRRMAEELDPPRLWRPEVLSSMEAKGFEQILADTKGVRSFHSFRDSLLQGEVTYFTAEADLLRLEMCPIDYNSKFRIPSWIPLPKLQILEVVGVLELWSSFLQHLQTNSQATFELRILRIFECPSLLNLPDLIEMFGDLEELLIEDSLDKTDTISFVQSLKQLRNLRSLKLFSGYWSRTGFYSGHLMDLSKGRNSSNFNSSTSSRLHRLETIHLSYLSNMSELVISGEMCPRLRSLEVDGMNDLNKIELIQLESLITLQVKECRELQTISGLSSLTGLRTFHLKDCPRLKSLPSLARLCLLENIRIDDCLKLEGVEGVEELPRLESMMIEMPREAGYARVRNYIHGPRAQYPLKELHINSDVEVVDSVMEEKELRERLESLSDRLEWLRWDGFPLNNLPSWLTLRNLKVLELHGANELEELWVDKAQAPLHLRELIITGTWSASFDRFPSSISHLKYLTKISLLGDVGKEFGIKGLPEEFCDLQSLEHLELRHCSFLSSLPARFGNLRSLRHLDMCSCKELRILPISFKQLRQLEHLDLSGCKKLALQIDILENITELNNLNFSKCFKLRQLPSQIVDQAWLRELRLQDTRLDVVPANIGQLRKLELLTIGSPFLTSLPVSLGELSSLKSLSIKDCMDLESLPETIRHLTLLEHLCIESSRVRSLPKGITELANLQTLKISGCPLGELDFGLGSPSPLENLRVIEISKTCVARISITEDCCPRLETLHINRNDYLEEIEILPTTVKKDLSEG